jgi:uncharacterized protein YoxC
MVMESTTATDQRETASINAAENSADGLINEIDDLLERYLELLDEYQKAREKLSSTFSEVGHVIKFLNPLTEPNNNDRASLH